MLVNDPWPHPRLQPYLLSVFSVVSDDQMHLETTAMSASVRRVHGGSERQSSAQRWQRRWFRAAAWCRKARRGWSRPCIVVERDSEVGVVPAGTAVLGRE